MTQSVTLPTWNTTSIFPSLQSQEFLAAKTTWATQLSELEALFDAHKVGQKATQNPSAPDAATVAPTVDDILTRFNAMRKQAALVVAYVACFVTTDSRNDLAQATQSELQPLHVQQRNLTTRLQAWLGSFPQGALEAQSTIAKDHAYTLECSRVAAQHQMSGPLEDLASSLNPTGSSAWAKLHNTITSQLVANVQWPTGATQHTMSSIRALAKDEDAATRHAAYQAELETWPTVAVPLAAALNSIKGETLLLAKRRGWASPLAQSVWENQIDEATLSAMQNACVEAFPDFRRYFRAKAKLLGYAGGLRWQDLFAPVGKTSRVWDFDAGKAFVAEQFGTFSPKMRELAERSYREDWIDVSPRPGKRDGAFCMHVRDTESRILLNFAPSLDALSTLAHELGHAYHNLCDGERSMLQRVRSMTLAETASTFCETVVMQAALKNADRNEQLLILDTELQGTAQIVVDIHSRFLFEGRVFAKRAERELSIEEFNQTMLAAQTETYGDGLDASTYHPYMWAVKNHYYSSTYYNYPYTFGQLFALGLYAQHQQDPQGFVPRYDNLLSRTGMADAATLAKDFGMDIRSEAFWVASLDVVRQSIRRFEALVEG